MSEGNKNRPAAYVVYNQEVLFANFLSPVKQSLQQFSRNLFLKSHFLKFSADYIYFCS